MDPNNTVNAVVDVDAYAETLPGAEIVLRFLGNVLSADPELDTVKLLRDTDFLSSIPFAASNADVQKGIAYLDEWRAEASDLADDDLLEAIKAQWLKVFIGPMGAVAPPWQSYYTADESLLFARETIQVRKWYKKYGLQIQKFNREPDDHIGIMLSFLAFLAREEMGRVEQGDSASVAEIQNDQLSFMITHLLTFLPAWAGRIDAKADSLYFKSLAAVTMGVVNERYQLLANSPWIQK